MLTPVLIEKLMDDIEPYKGIYKLYPYWMNSVDCLVTHDEEPVKDNDTKIKEPQ